MSNNNSFIGNTIKGFFVFEEDRKHAEQNEEDKDASKDEVYQQDDSNIFPGE